MTGHHPAIPEPSGIRPFDHRAPSPLLRRGLDHLAEIAHGSHASLAAVQSDPLELLWLFDSESESGYISVMGLAGDILCIATERDVFALDRTSGSQRWRYQAPDNTLIYTDADSPLIVNQIVYLRTGPSLHALDLATGDERWSWSLSEEENWRRDAPLQVCDGLVGCATTSGYNVWDAWTGEERWHHICRHGSWASTADAVYLINHGDWVVASRRDSGAFLWSTHIDPWWMSSPRLGYFDVHAGVIVIAYGSFYLDADLESSREMGNELYGIDILTGHLLWHVKIQPHQRNMPPDLTFANEMIFVHTSANHLSALDIRTGDARWTVETQLERAWVEPFGETVYLSYEGDTFVALDPDSGRVRWRFHSPDASPGLALASTGAVYISTGSVLHALNARDGTETWRLTYDECQSIGKDDISVVTGERSDTIYTSYNHDHDDKSDCDAGTLYAIDITTGFARWKISGVDSGVYGERVILTSGSSVYIEARNLIVALRDNTLTDPLTSGRPPHYLLLGYIFGPEQRSDVFFRLS